MGMGGVFMGKRTKVQCDVWFWLKSLVMPPAVRGTLLLEGWLEQVPRAWEDGASAGEAKPNTEEEQT